MPKYLWCVSYSTEGVKGVLKEGGTGRREAVEKLAADLGATIESFYFSFGEDDAYIIADIPDNTTAAAISLAGSDVGASAAIGAGLVGAGVCAGVGALFGAGVGAAIPSWHVVYERP